ncbi:60S ribosomal protein L31 [Acropora cervicornis]|uniref:60S ribosomal protein L31 n=1 Tax=Acropora cervicornis TaxID=6130 RepID=A0AAD9Q7D4_ACRCE|nr:60S ribosomal protein L31 [Acropora cervicornis]
MSKKTEKRKGRSAINEVVTREYTINVHKRVHNVGFRRRAPRAIKEIRKFAEKMMGTPDVRIDTSLNKHRNEDEDSIHKLYTLVTHVPVVSFKGMQTQKVESEE